MPKQHKLFTLSDEVVEKLGWIAKNWGTSNSGAVSALIVQAHRVLTGRLGGEELCRMVWDADESELQFMDLSGRTLAVFTLAK